MKKVLLIGAAPLTDTSFIKEYDDCYFIACDGGYLAYKKQHKEVDLFVGDFDTLKKSDLNNPKEILSLSVIKDDTDTLFAIKHALKQGYDTFYLYGCLGGKIEHTIANIQVLSFLSLHNAKGYLFDEQNNVLFLLKNSSLTFKKATGYLSIFAVDKEVKGVNLRNLKYELQDATLTSSFPLGISNEFLLDKEASISVQDGCLLIVAPKDSLTF